ncbi:MAG: MFS transporter [Patescibacteria group bacterium]
MTVQQARRNIKLYYWFQLFKEPFFWGAILITYINRVSGMTLSDIYFMESVCVIGIVILDAPFGALADLIGRRYTLLIGSIIMAVKILVFASACNPLMIWLANLCWVFAISLISGADTSMLADTLKVLGRENDFRHIEGRSQSYRLAGMAIGALLAGYMAQWHLRLPVFASFPFIVAAIPVTYMMVDPPMVAQKHKNWKEYVQLLKLSVLFVFNHRQVKWIISFTVLISVASKLWFFTYNPYFELVNLPLSQFGWMFCLLNIVAALSSHEAARMHRYLGDLGSVAVMVVFLAVPIWFMGWQVTKISILLILMQNVVRGYVSPFLGGFLHQYLDSENRATVASIKSTASSIAQSVFLALFGLALMRWSLPFCLEILGLGTGLVGLLLIFSYSRVFRSSRN